MLNACKRQQRQLVSIYLADAKTPPLVIQISLKRFASGGEKQSHEISPLWLRIELLLRLNTKDSRLKTQDSRFKTQDWSLNAQDSCNSDSMEICMAKAAINKSFSFHFHFEIWFNYVKVFVYLTSTTFSGKELKISCNYLGITQFSSLTVFVCYLILCSKWNWNLFFQALSLKFCARGMFLLLFIKREASSSLSVYSRMYLSFRTRPFSFIWHDKLPKTLHLHTYTFHLRLWLFFFSISPLLTVVSHANPGTKPFVYLFVCLFTIIYLFVCLTLFPLCAGRAIDNYHHHRFGHHHPAQHPTENPVKVIRMLEPPAG